jgi:hypothetical protein
MVPLVQAMRIEASSTAIAPDWEDQTLMTLERTSRAAAALALGAVFLLVSGACRGREAAGDPTVRVDFGVSPTPATVGRARLLLTVTDSADVPVNGASIHIRGDMKHAGMDPVEERAEPLGDGRYIVPGFPFTMAGDWVLTASVTMPDGSLVVRPHPVTVVGEWAPGTSGVRDPRR